MKKIVFFLFLILFINFISAEILINQNTQNQENQDDQINSATQNLAIQNIQVKHDFEINIYYPNKTNINETQKEITAIMINPILAENEIIQCSEANYSFKITNPSKTLQVYSFSIKNFKGTAYITPNLELSPKQSKIVQLKLIPDCETTGILNPKIYIETEKEEAEMPLILKINQGNFIKQDDCLYYYNSTVCDSSFYIKFKKNTQYKIDLSKWFYDPDGDQLSFSAKTGNKLEISIKRNTAYLKPEKNWYGKEEITFFATDSKGGKVQKTFYTHVVNKEQSFFEKILSFFGF